MNESLFQISCPSCESVFAVTDPELIGQIVACPKCGGMMLVEAAQTARNEETAQETKDASNGETGKNSESGEVREEVAETSPAVVAPPVLPVETESAPQNERNAETTFPLDAENSEIAQDGETLTSEGGGKSARIVLALVGVAVALVILCAIALFLTRGARNGASEAPEVAAETENGEIGENNENGEVGEDALGIGENEADGGLAPVAAEERTPDAANAESTEEDETNKREDLGETEETAEADVLGEMEQTGGSGGLSDPGDSQNGEKTPAPDASEENGATSDEGLGEPGETGGLEEAGSLDDLDGLGEFDGEPSEEEIAASDEAESEGEETETSTEKLAGSNASTGFNEADFERANQNVDPESDEAAEVDWSGVASTTSPTLQGALPTLRRERKEIDVEARLALPIKSIEFPTSPVAAIRLLAEFTGVSIVPELETFVLTRPATTATLDLSLRDATAGEALETIANLLKWEVCKEKERLVIRPAGFDADAFVEERFDVADLIAKKSAAPEATRLEKFELPNNLTPETLAALVRSLVAPDSWRENGGRATLKIEETALIVGQTAQNREKTRILLEGLRAIRGLEPQTDAAPERIIPEKLGWENLAKKTTFNPLTPPALQNAVEILEKSQKFQTFWDDAALNEAGVGRDLTTSARGEGKTVDAALTEILEPLNATYLILGERLILITSEEAARDYETVEFFSLLGKDGARPSLEEARALADEIKATVAPTSGEFASVGENAGAGEVDEIGEIGEENANADDLAVESVGETGETGETLAEDARSVVWLDVESACLIIRQSQPKQRALRRWLAARDAEATQK